MSGINIGTNFNYQGSNFLDSRQGLPQTKDDLLTWDVLVPLGFETCVRGEWYVYKGENYWNIETGHWERRIDTSGIEAEIEKLNAAVFPMDLIVSGGGIYELGSSILPDLRWALKIESTTFIPDRVQIDGLEIDNPGDNQWSPSSPINANHTYTIRVWYNSSSYSSTVHFEFKQKKYWGVISNPSTFDDVLGLHSSWADSWEMDTTVFNCTGGYYPAYIIPRSLWPGEETFKVWVGGFQTTDYTYTIREIENMSGYESEYVIITLGHIQTGILNIKFDIE